MLLDVESGLVAATQTFLSLIHCRHYFQKTKTSMLALLVFLIFSEQTPPLSQAQSGVISGSLKAESGMPAVGIRVAALAISRREIGGQTPNSLVEMIDQPSILPRN